MLSTIFMKPYKGIRQYQGQNILTLFKARKGGIMNMYNLAVEINKWPEGVDRWCSTTQCLAVIVCFLTGLIYYAICML